MLRQVSAPKTWGSTGPDWPEAAGRDRERQSGERDDGRANHGDGRVVMTGVVTHFRVLPHTAVSLGRLNAHPRDLWQSCQTAAGLPPVRAPATEPPRFSTQRPRQRNGVPAHELGAERHAPRRGTAARTDPRQG